MSDVESKVDGPPEVSVVMPCLNEAETIETCVRKAVACLAENGVDGEVVVGDNGSTDGSRELARKAGARVVDVPARGYGAALDGGIRAARGKYIIMGDADDSYDFSGLMPFIEKLREGYDLVMGNRFKGGIKDGAMPWKNRYIGNPILSGIGNLFFCCPASDFHCGLRGFSAEAYPKMDLHTTGMEFASEMVIKATLKKMKIAEVPTTLSPDGRSRPPHLKPWRDGWRHLRFMLMYSPRWLFFYPGLLLMLIGTVLGLWLAAGTIGLGDIELGVHTMFYAGVMVLVGYQAVVFAAFSRIYSAEVGLLPPSGLLTKLYGWFTLELGVLAGVALLLGGLAGSFAGFWQWWSAGFGSMQPESLFRILIPSGVALALGAQTIFASFFMSLLGLPRREAIKID